jgi:hypothetical protein
VNPQKGDVLKWADSKGNPIAVHFIPVRPCSDNIEGQCTINVDSGRILYTCDHCADPEIVVGSDVSGTLAGGGGGVAATPPTATLFLTCESNAIKMYDQNGNGTSTVSIPASTVTAGKASILWQGIGVPVLTDWQASTFTPSNPCTQADPFKVGNALCSLKTTATGTTTYNVTAASCTTPLNGAQIVVTP